MTDDRVQKPVMLTTKPGTWDAYLKLSDGDQAAIMANLDTHFKTCVDMLRPPKSISPPPFVTVTTTDGGPLDDEQAEGVEYMFRDMTTGKPYVIPPGVSVAVNPRTSTARIIEHEPVDDEVMEFAQRRMSESIDQIVLDSMSWCEPNPAQAMGRAARAVENLGDAMKGAAEAAKRLKTIEELDPDEILNNMDKRMYKAAGEPVPEHITAEDRKRISKLVARRAMTITCPTCGESLNPEADVLPSTGEVGCWKCGWQG